MPIRTRLFQYFLSGRSLFKEQQLVMYMKGPPQQVITLLALCTVLPLCHRKIYSRIALLVYLHAYFERKLNEGRRALRYRI